MQKSALQFAVCFFALHCMALEFTVCLAMLFTVTGNLAQCTAFEFTVFSYPFKFTTSILLTSTGNPPLHCNSTALYWKSLFVFLHCTVHSLLVSACNLPCICVALPSTTPYSTTLPYCLSFYISLLVSAGNLPCQNCLTHSQQRVQVQCI